MHDYYFDKVPDATEKFPQKSRSDGHYYVIGFTLEEIKSSRVTEPFHINNLSYAVADYPTRFPLWSSDFKIPIFFRNKLN